MGWVDTRRDHGQLVFIDLRDRAGITQVVFEATNATVHDLAKTLRSEFVIAATGKVRVRGEGLANPNLKTGEIEVVAESLTILSEAKTTPFPIENDTRRPATEVPLSGSAPPETSGEFPPAPQSECGHSKCAGPIRILGGRDSDFDQVHSGRRSRLSRAEPALSRKFLCAAAITSAVQAVIDDFRIRTVLPDRPLFP
jgi:hypothetical protein